MHNAHHLFLCPLHTGPLATNLGIEGTAFLSSALNNVSYGVDWPDIQLLFYPLQLASDGGVLFRDFLGLSNKVRSHRARAAISDTVSYRTGQG